MRITPFLIAAAIGTIGVTADAQRRGAGAAGSATLAVTLADPSGTPIGNALVTLEGAAKRSGRTERGRIVFENVPAANYRLRFESDGFITLEREIAARGRAPIDVKVTLTPAPPVKPVPCVPVAPAPAPAAPVAAPMSLDLPAFIEKNHVGRNPSRVSEISCTPGGSATLIQIREPMPEQRHEDADEFLYVIAGAGAVRIGDRIEALQSGVLALVPRTTAHVITAKGRSPLFVLSIRAGEKCAAAQK